MLFLPDQRQELQHNPKGQLRKTKPEPTTTIRARVTELEKSQLEDFCQEHNLKLSDLLRIGARFVMKHPELL